MNNKINLLKELIIITFSCVSGFLFYWYCTLEVVELVYHIDNLLTALFFIFCNIYLFYILLKILFKIPIRKFDKITISICYIIMLLISFFDRFMLDSSYINLNPMDFVNTIKYNGYITLFVNVLLFLPFFSIIKFINKEFKFNIITSIFLIFIFCVEIFQYISLRGIFDIVDLILYSIGYLIGIKFYFYLFEPSRKE